MPHKFHTHHHYLLFEFDNKGYVLRYLNCPNGDIKAIKKSDKIYYLIASKEEEGYSSQEIVDELGFLSSYPIKTHKEKIQGYIDAPNCFRFTSASANNVFYYLSSTRKIEDFSKLIRYDESRYTMFLNNITNPEGFEDTTELYLN